MKQNDLDEGQHNPSSRKQTVRRRLAPAVSDELAEVKLLTPAHLISLRKNKVRTLNDLADLASEELIEILGTESITRATADQVIMGARAHWFKSE